MAETEPDRRAALLDAAIAVFLRYGFKKASMDAVAKAAGLSRQGVYLHHPTKEALFRAALEHLGASARRAAAAAIARDDRSVEERVFGAFEALHVTVANSEHMDELLATAGQILGESLVQLEDSIVADLARALKSLGVAAAWQEQGISAKVLAETLYAASQGFKQRKLSRAAYLERMRAAVRIVCRPVDG
ncbi:MAG: TetR/AcrR family transcriptional regulator [Deltaproteobacteria bacterium]|nr:TetR/AcrR family transcriptional regulator [Nannocystaceae bacterium]